MMDGWTEGPMDKPKAIYPLIFFQRHGYNIINFINLPHIQHFYRKMCRCQTGDVSIFIHIF